MSEQRKYTLDEIDAMRKGVEMLLIPAASSAKVEERLRTYILAGIAPEPLIEKGKKMADAWFVKELERLQTTR